MIIKGHTAHEAVFVDGMAQWRPDPKDIPGSALHLVTLFDLPANPQAHGHHLSGGNKAGADESAAL